MWNPEPLAHSFGIDQGFQCRHSRRQRRRQRGALSSNLRHQRRHGRHCCLRLCLGSLCILLRLLRVSHGGRRPAFGRGRQRVHARGLGGDDGFGLVEPRLQSVGACLGSIEALRQVGRLQLQRVHRGAV